MTGLTEQARQDFKIMKVRPTCFNLLVLFHCIIEQDIATHTRISPGQREVSFRKFVDRVNKCPKVIVVCSVTRTVTLLSYNQAREELESWGLQLDPRMIQLEGRTLNPEKIMFKNSTQSAGPEADWSRHAVKEKVISAVSSPT